MVGGARSRGAELGLEISKHLREEGLIDTCVFGGCGVFVTADIYV